MANMPFEHPILTPKVQALVKKYWDQETNHLLVSDRTILCARYSRKEQAVPRFKHKIAVPQLFLPDAFPKGH